MGRETDRTITIAYDSPCIALSYSEGQGSVLENPNAAVYLHHSPMQNPDPLNSLVQGS
jgi:hypothetical protein